MTNSRRSFLKLGVAGLAAPTILTSTQLAAAAPKLGAQVPGVYRQSVGDFEVTAILDGVLPVTPETFTGYDEAKAAAALESQFLPASPEGQVIPVVGYLVNTGDKLVAIDTGTNDGFVDTLGGYHAALAASGYSADQVDVVIATHLHLDHIGGMVDGSGSKRFPNAELITTAPEWDFWYNDEIRAQVPDNFKPFFDIARAQTTPYEDKLALATTGAEALPGFEIVALPGHTPGHIGVHLRSNGEELLIWGDVMHASRLQFANPDWTIAFDVDQDVARATRAKLLDQVATDKVAIAGMHLDFPGFGHVERAGSAYRFVPMPWRYSL